MMASETDLSASDLPDNLHGIRTAIEQAVPHGRTSHGGGGDKGAWQRIPERTSRMSGVKAQIPIRIDPRKHPKLDRGNHSNHLGTLGTGNHFIEVCLDESDKVWFMLHSGSRGVGNRMGTYFIELAKRDMGRLVGQLAGQGPCLSRRGNRAFCRLRGSSRMGAGLCSHQSRLDDGANHRGRSEFRRSSSDSTDIQAINCHHNYVARERHYGQDILVTRKGAVRAREGDLGIIPGSMGARSFIVRGKGNPESFSSCSHGAGRAMSRTEAKRRFTIEDHKRMTEGVECRKDAGVIDETPAAYKSIDAVMEAQSDLVDIVHTLRQVVCVKG